MILDACNTSAEIEIEGTEKAFTNIYTNEFPGKNISDLATTTLRNIKVTSGEYTVTPKLGMTLLFNVCKT